METIYSYTKEDAVADGDQIEISGFKAAVEAGFRVPVYLTRSVWEYTEVPEGCTGQDHEGRLWDLCSLATNRVRQMSKAGDDTGPGEFTVRFVTAPNKHEDVRLWIMFNGAEGFTIMQPSEY